MPQAHANPLSSQPFWRDALAWGGAVTPHLVPRLLGFALYGGLVALAHRQIGWRGVDVVHLGYIGGVLGVLLVLRTNAGYDRWWEGRRVWGGIVNQSRNLAIKAAAYVDDPAWVGRFIRWTNAFCHAARMSLRGQRSDKALREVLPDDDAVTRLLGAHHMPNHVGLELAALLAKARADGRLDGFAFTEVDRERALLIDYIGACERIHRTPLPRVHAIKVRRLILMYLVAVPLAIASDSPWLSALATALVAYPLLAIDQIAHELEDPFDITRESHLPLDVICERIQNDLRALLPPEPSPSASH